jgi:hypothetical protein
MSQTYGLWIVGNHSGKNSCIAGNVTKDEIEAAIRAINDVRELKHSLGPLDQEDDELRLEIIPSAIRMIITKSTDSTLTDDELNALWNYLSFHDINTGNGLRVREAIRSYECRLSKNTA